MSHSHLTVLFFKQDQFVFLHKAVLEAYTGRNTTIPSEGFEAVFRKEISAHKQDQKIDKEFEVM